MKNKSVLETLDKNYSLFYITDGEIVTFFTLSDEINIFISLLMQKSNNHYYESCCRNNVHPKEQCRIVVKKDASGLCYLQIIGHDNHTQILVYNDKYGNYFPEPVAGYRISESDFAEQLDEYEKTLLSYVPKRFLKENVPPINLAEEIDVDKLIEYYAYLKYDYLQPETKVAYYDEAQDIIPRRNNVQRNITPSERKNEIIEYELRKRMLLEHLPVYRLKVIGKNTNTIREAYVYEREGNVLVIIEPVSGTGYRYDINLGPIDLINEEAIYQKIIDILETKEEDILMDASIIRKSHTSVISFKESLDVFLKGEKNLTGYYYKVKRQQEHYKSQVL